MFRFLTLRSPSAAAPLRAGALLKAGPCSSTSSRILLTPTSLLSTSSAAVSVGRLSSLKGMMLSPLQHAPQVARALSTTLLSVRGVSLVTAPSTLRFSAALIERASTADSLVSPALAVAAVASEGPASGVTENGVTTTFFASISHVNIATLVSFGGLLGLASGVAVRRLGEFVLLYVGLTFIALNVLVYTGVVTVDWDQIKAKAEPLLDQTELMKKWQGVKDFMATQVPFSLTFSTGFIIGVMYA